MNKIATSALLALAGVVIIAQSASAASTTAYTKGDILLGIRSTGGTGSTLEYIVNLGSNTQFTTLASIPAFSIGNIAADLSANFGNNWYTSGNLQFGLMGQTYNSANQNGTGNRTVWASNPSATPWNTGPNISAPRTAISGLTATGYAGKLSTDNSAVGLLQDQSSTSSYTSYQAYQGTNGSLAFGYFDGGIEVGINQSLYLDKVVQGAAGPGTLLGTVTVDSAGDVSFVGAQAVPEPSTYAFLTVAAAGLGFLGMVRRRAVKA